MKSKSFYFRVSFLLLTLLIVRVSSLHVYTHDNDSETAIEQCAICDVVLENQHPQITGGTNYGFNAFEIPVATTAHFAYSAISDSRFQLFSFFGRPPPV